METMHCQDGAHQSALSAHDLVRQVIALCIGKTHVSTLLNYIYTTINQYHLQWTLKEVAQGYNRTLINWESGQRNSRWDLHSCKVINQGRV